MIGSSIGIATYPDDARTQHDLMRIADMAMYQAKAAGGNAIRAFDGSVYSRAKAR
jgi:diguanylate cyclase (GGDEF)-like protein